MTTINSKVLFEIKDKIKKVQKAHKPTLIAVTKTHPKSAVESSIEKGVYDIGENKVQETEQKLKDYIRPSKMKVHLIGHLQKNKVRKAVRIFDYIQTVDSLSLAKKINKIAKEENKVQKVFLQVNIGNLKNRYGFLTKEIEIAANIIKLYKNIDIEGIMIIPPLTDNKKKYLNYFKSAKEIQSKVEKKIKTCTKLSMGMTNDYIDAIKAGATHIRIGTALFGKRKK
ncbi:MAG: YggS family pyridoxal phosphate-dependent enzyme [Candidatus Marinimicrobia bacterium]|nr:YggS family pyridoxal phosphate-dependent enzyme [Candidatus Neomarinimicrobiota bacterium]